MNGNGRRKDGKYTNADLVAPLVILVCAQVQQMSPYPTHERSQQVCRGHRVNVERSQRWLEKSSSDGKDSLVGKEVKRNVKAVEIGKHKMVGKS